MADTTAIQATLDELGETPEIDRVLMLMDQISFIKAWVKDVEPRVKAYVIDRIAKTKMPIAAGDKLWMMTQKKSVKCNSPALTLSALFEATEGDEERVAECLAANSWKHGTVRRMLDELEERKALPKDQRGKRFATLFTEVVQRDIEGKPVKELALVDPAFMTAK